VWFFWCDKVACEIGMWYYEVCMIRKFFNLLNQAYKHMLSEFSLFVLEANMRSKETTEARAMRLITEDIDSLNK